MMTKEYKLKKKKMDSSDCDMIEEASLRRTVGGAGGGPGGGPGGVGGGCVGGGGTARVKGLGGGTLLENAMCDDWQYIRMLRSCTLTCRSGGS